CDQVVVTVGRRATAAPAAEQKLVVYSGRSESLVAPLFEQFTQDTGIAVEARYGDTAELAATILEEGANSPADLFFAQDAGALGALGAAGLLAPLPEASLDAVEPRFRSANGDWVGVSGRARVVVYNTEQLSEEDLPASITGFAAPEWQGRVGWAPTNGSFQAFVTAMRVQLGEEAARGWLEEMIANDTRVYERNAAIVNAVAAGEIDVGFVNHYYLYQIQAETGNTLQAANYYPQDGDVGALINIAGVGLLNTARNAGSAQELVTYLLSADGQRYFAEKTFEYPLTDAVQPDPRLRPLSEIQTPELDLNNLSDLQGTLQLLQEVGAL
ncbi:MAG TPA: iron ABC transporter substrate-binding protein, partial [Chloroflexaceae bacterium]|nr:iron ABC transporter substrate-binding protein [Chloroflexaceae bacterium]